MPQQQNGNQQLLYLYTALPEDYFTLGYLTPFLRKRQYPSHPPLHPSTTLLHGVVSSSEMLLAMGLGTYLNT